MSVSPMASAVKARGTGAAESGAEAAIGPGVESAVATGGRQDLHAGTGAAATREPKAWAHRRDPPSGQPRQIHEVEAREVPGLLRGRRSGLLTAEIAARRAEIGPNQLEPPPRGRWLRILSRHVLNFFSLLLDLAAAVCFVADQLQPHQGMALLGAALLGVSVLNALFAFAQEMRAERAMEELKRFLPPLVRVRRGGREQQVPAEDLVPGDILLIGEGDRIAADARLIEAEDLLVNNAPLTGESRSLALKTTPARGRMIDSPNIAFAGCGVLRGRGTAVVFATGHRTELGKIAALSRDLRRPLSPLQRETSRMVRVLTAIAVVMGLAFFAVGVASGRPLWVNIVFMLGIIVANVPEGLLPTFTLALSMASLRMARKQVLVKSLEAVESLGAVHVICTDKTGTLTENALALAAVIDPLSGERIMDLESVDQPGAAKGGGDEQPGRGSAPGPLGSGASLGPDLGPGHGSGLRAGPASGSNGAKPGARAILSLALIASELRPAARAFGQDRPDPDRHHQNTARGWSGDPLDVALAEGFARHFGAPERILAETRRHFPFDLAKRREAGVYANDHAVVFAIKGAWESLRPLIGRVQAGDGALVAADDQTLAACDALVQRLSASGQRIIAVAARPLAAVPDSRAPEESLERGLTLRGFLALDDPIRAEVPAAVARCHDAGIQVILITGDHPDTAMAVARACGILSADAPAERHLLHGDALERLRETQLMQRLHDGVCVFSRTTPEQKMKIVLALKRLGEVVAMTGDGVNDTPALKAADVGIAMGIGGTEVAREAADIVLLDDNFASIAAGVEEGRAVFANMRKFTTYVLASNIPEILPFLLYVVLPVPLALTVIQILSIDLGTDLLPAIGLGREPPEPEIMRCPPRRLDERLLSGPLMGTAYLFLGLIQAGFSLALFFWVLHQGGWHWGEPLAETDPLYRSATGLTLASIMLMQVANVVGRRSLRGSGLDRGLWANRLLLLGVGTEILFSAAVLYAPPVQTFLGTGPVDWSLYALAWLGIPLLFLLDVGRKWLVGRAPAAAR